MENIAFGPVMGGLVGQYGVGMVLPADTSDDNVKMAEHAAVGVGAWAMGAPPMVAAGAAAVDFGLCLLYKQVPSLDVLTPVRGGIAVAGAQMALPMLGM